MYVTIVEGSVAEERVADLLAAWNANTEATPAGLIESSLLRSETGVWRIVTVWESREAVMAMRASGRPAALTMFERAGSEGSVTMWEVEGRIRAPRD
ncbi:MAG TPA: antibiotic biosynthesis monooxygenase [Streptosporangiaceae bacterium]